MNDQSSFHWTEFLVYFFYLFHLEKTEFTLEMLTHARLSKVLACVALKKRRSFSSFFLLLLDLEFFLWIVGGTSSNLFLEADLGAFCLCSMHLFSQSCSGTLRTCGPKGFCFWKGWEGEKRNGE